MSATSEMIIEGGLDGESLADSRCMNRAKLKACVYAGVHQAESLTIESNKICSCGVSRLHGWSRPDAIVFRITQIVVLPIKAMAFTWAWTHISEKIRKLFPSRVNRDAASSVMLKHFMIRIGGSADHSLPRRILRGSSRPWAVSMFFHGLFFQASTGFRTLPSKLRGNYRCGSPTAALAEPADMTRVRLGAMQYGQSSKDLSCQINGPGLPFPNFSTPARLCVPRCQPIRRYKRDTSAQAPAFPSKASRRIRRTSKYEQITELFSGKVESFHKLFYTGNLRLCQQP